MHAVNIRIFKSNKDTDSLLLILKLPITLLSTSLYVKKQPGNCFFYKQKQLSVDRSCDSELELHTNTISAYVHT